MVRSSKSFRTNRLRRVPRLHLARFRSGLESGRVVFMTTQKGGVVWCGVVWCGV